MRPAPRGLDEENRFFWDELCGSGLAAAIGLEDRSAQSLARFDEAYLGIYPYLLKRVPVHEMSGQRVLEVGLGFGTLGRKIVEAGADYSGLDISEGPVRMMNARLQMLGREPAAVQGSMLDCPFEDGSFDAVVSIGCFHHTGDTQRCFDETYRILRPGGRAYAMVYNAFSFRQWSRWPWETLRRMVEERRAAVTRGVGGEEQRKAYDADSKGRGAPFTEFLSIRQLRKMLSRFSDSRFRKENCDPITIGNVQIDRERILSTLGRALGLDIYIQATK